MEFLVKHKSILPRFETILLLFAVFSLLGIKDVLASSTYLGETGLVEVPLTDTVIEGRTSVAFWLRYSNIDGEDDIRPAAIMFETGIFNRTEMGFAYMSSGGTDPFLFNGIDNLRANIKYRITDELKYLPSLGALATVEDLLGEPVYGARGILQKRIDHTTVTVSGGYLSGKEEKRTIVGGGIIREMRYNLDAIVESTAYFPTGDDPQEDNLYLVTPALRYNINPKISVILSASYGTAGDIEYGRSMLGVNFMDYDPHNIDRDGDGIVDRNDDCPREDEDVDGWQDEDGCPDLDNDGDTIPDSMDDTPNGEDKEKKVIEYSTPRPEFRIKIKQLTVPGSTNGYHGTTPQGKTNGTNGKNGKHDEKPKVDTSGEEKKPTGKDKKIFFRMFRTFRFLLEK